MPSRLVPQVERASWEGEGQKGSGFSLCYALEVRKAGKPLTSTLTMLRVGEKQGVCR